MGKDLVYGYYGRGNYGDDIIYRSLNEKYKSLEYFDLNFKSSKNLVGFFNEISRYQNTLKKADRLIFGGGTQFFYSNEGKNKSLFLKSLVILIASYNGVKVILERVGIGRVNSISLFFLFFIVNFSDELILRDKRSLRISKRLSIGDKSIKLGRDFFYLDKRINKNINREGFKNVGINFIDYYSIYEFNPSKRNKFKEELLIELQDLKKSYNLTGISCQSSKDKSSESSFLKEVGIENIISYEGDIHRFEESVNNMDFIVANRYHLLLLAISLRIPFLACNYNFKVKEEIKMLGAEKCLITYDEVSKLSQKVNAISVHKENIYSEFRI